MCTDFASIGAGDRTSGRTMISFAAWAGLEIALETPVIVLENSPRLDDGTVTKVFGRAYVVQIIRVCGSKFGWVGCRPRLWAVMTHKVYIMSVVASLKNVIPMFYRTCELSWRSVLHVMPTEIVEAEVQQDLQWACGRPASKAHKLPFSEVVKRPDRCRFALSDAEESWLDENERLHGFLQCHNLSQDSLAGRGVCTKGDLLYTIVRNPAIHFSTPDERWLVSSDLLMLQGFPILSQLSNPRGAARRLTTFCVDDPCSPLPIACLQRGGSGEEDKNHPMLVDPSTCPLLRRKRSLVNEMVGNSMNGPTACAVLIYALLFTVERKNDANSRFVSLCLGGRNSDSV